MKFERLIKLVREEKVSLFIGSGFSLKAGAPSTSILCESLLSHFDNDQQRQAHITDGLAQLANYYVEEICCGSRNSLIDLLQRQFSFTPQNTEDHQALARIPHFHDIFTTNYDTLLEDSYDKNECQVIRKDADCAYVDDSKPVRIYKIHGDFNNQDFIVITSKDYEDYFKNNQNPLLWEEVKESFKKKHMLFLGYSLEDGNITDIINNICQTIKQNQKDMFLIAPGLNEEKRGKLRSMKVHYYDATADEFLAQLTQELRDNIWNDFKHHKITTETFTNFCHLHNIDPTISFQPKKDNQIVNYKSVDGKELRHEIDLKMPPQYKEIFDNIDFEKNGVIIKDSPFPHLPLLKIAKEDLLDFSLRVNGILIKDNAESVFLAPVAHKKNITIRIPSRSFLEKTELTIYSPRKGKGIIEFECAIYVIKIALEMKASENSDDGVNVNINLEFKDNYLDNNDAIKWIDLVCAFFDNEDIYVNEWSKEPLKKYLNEITDKQRYSVLYNKFKTYYENIKQIEILTGKTFSNYHGYTEDAFTISTMIIAYLKKEPTQLYSNDGFDFSSENDPDEDFVKAVKDKSKFTALYTVAYEKGFVLNEQTFKIPYALLILEPSVVTQMTKCDNGKFKIDFHCDSKTIKAIYTDDPMPEKLPI